MPGRRIATVLMLDVVGSTHIAAQLGDARYRELSSRFNRLVRAALKRFGGKEEDHAGDGFFATFPQPDRAIRCAAALSEEVRNLGIEIRSGIHTGQTEDQAGKAHGIAVVIGARVMSLAGAGEILVTSTTKELVTGSGFGFEDFSAHELKGVPGTWQVFAVTGVNDEPRTRPLPAAEAAERRAAIEPSTRPERPRRLVLVAASIGILIIATVGVVLTRGEPRPDTPRRPMEPASGSVVQLDTNGDMLDTILAPAAQNPSQFTSVADADDPLVVGQGGVWTLRQRRILFHLDPRTSDVRAEIPLDVPLFANTINVAEGFDAIWAAHGQGLIRVKPATDEQELVARIPPGPLGITNPADVAVGAGHVWVGTGRGTCSD
jgi:class 3 adenylate cyclase